MWFWRYEEHDLYYETGQQIRLKVKLVEYSKAEEMHKYTPPMLVHVSKGMSECQLVILIVRKGYCCRGWIRSTKLVVAQIKYI